MAIFQGQKKVANNAILENGQIVKMAVVVATKRGLANVRREVVRNSQGMCFNNIHSLNL